MFRRLVISLNNFMVSKRALSVPPHKLLLLLPHCLQRSQCERNILRNVESCERCGKCEMARILRMRDELGIQCRVVGGGREALLLSRDPNIKAIVACACEKELVDGILAAFPKPVLAVVNRRPNGPCKDTHVDICQLRLSVMQMTKRENESSTKACSGGANLGP